MTHINTFKLCSPTALALNPDAENPDVSIVAISSTLPCDWTLRPSVNYLNGGEVDPDCSVKTPTTAPTTNSGYLIAGGVAAILSFVAIIIIVLIVAYRRRHRGHISLKQKR